MADYALLELGLQQWDQVSYRVRPRLSLPDQGREIRPDDRDPILARFDLERLGREADYDDRYGELLTQSLFEDERLKEFFDDARDRQAEAGVPLRLRLDIDLSSPELHELRWETLRDPKNPDAWLSLDENVLLSRYLGSSSLYGTPRAARADLKALVLVASPDNLDQGMAPVNVPRELEGVRKGLGTIAVDALCRCQQEVCENLEVNIVGCPTLDELIDRLRVEEYDILYLVAHGRLHNRIPQVWLEDEDGKADIVEQVGARGLITRLRQMAHSSRLPQLVVLASCQSGGAGKPWATQDGGALSAFGPRLAQSGVPAVVAMQGDVTMKTMAEFAPKFFSELRSEDAAWGWGQIDYAMATARRAVYEAKRDDWWTPVLFMNLSGGGLWYKPGLTGGETRWPSLVNSIKQERCTAIIGRGVSEWLLGRRRDIARDLAREYGFPLARHKRESLPQVSQFLAVRFGRQFVRDELRKYLSQGIRERYRAQKLGEPLTKEARERMFGDLEATLTEEDLDLLISAVGRWQREQDPSEPHYLLARLPIPVYITSGFTSLLYDALANTDQAVGGSPKTPEVEILGWRSHDCPQSHRPGSCASVFDRADSYEPSANRPLVYHLFGHVRDPRSLVLTEDDYFDWLIRTSSEQVRIHPTVEGALTEKTLLILGFKLEDWDLRMLLRLRKQLPGTALIDDEEVTHVAVQMDPGTEHILKPEAAREYLTRFFTKHGSFDVYWGSTQDFLERLAAEL